MRAAAGFLTRLALGALILTTAAVLVDTAPAAAQTAQGWQDDSAISAGATNPGTSGAQPVSSGGGGGGGRGSVATCTAVDGTVGPVGYVPVPQDILGADRKAYAAENNGAYYWKSCGGQDANRSGSFLAGATFLPNGTRGPVPVIVDPVALAQEALQRAPLAAPNIKMAPDPSIPQLVNLATFLWIDPAQWRPQSASATAGAVTSTVTATPTRVVWDMGQGDTVTCNGPGAPYVPTLPDDAQPSNCKFTYPASSARSPDKTFTITATIEWPVTWAASGAPGGGDLGISRSSSSTPVRVAEVHVLNTAARS